LHLNYHRIDGSTHKHRTVTEPLLGYFENNPDLLPLFVSKGDSTSKMRSIRRNEYLSFAYSRFVRHKGDLVIFGQSQGRQFDGHITDAMRRWPDLDQRRRRDKGKPKAKRTIAVSIYPKNGREAVRQEQLRVLGFGGDAARRRSSRNRACK
jgi:hypothetical protein